MADRGWARPPGELWRGPAGAGTLNHMPTREELEQLSSKQLHDRAVGVAEHRLDVVFLWRLIKAIPVAEAAAGNLGQSEADVAVGDLMPLLHDLDHADEGPLADALRPMYIEYLAEHDKDEP